MRFKALVVGITMVTGCSSSSTVASGPADGASSADGAADGSKDGPAGNDAAVDAGEGGAVGTCGIVFDWRVRNPPGGSTPAECQAGLDQDCCSQEMACAANADCKQMLQCMNACPNPKADACLTACQRDAGQSEFLAVGDCSKNAAPHLPAACAFP